MEILCPSKNPLALEHIYGYNGKSTAKNELHNLLRHGLKIIEY